MSQSITFENLEQGSDEWLQARCGIITASTMHNLVTPGGKVSESEKAYGFIKQLAAERITGHPEVTYPTRPMQRGTMLEPFARDEYVKITGNTVEEIGFMRLDTDQYRLGFSPDGLVGEDGIIEIKCPSPKEHLRTMLTDKVPSQYVPQVQVGLYVSGREWCDFVSYCPGAAPYVTRMVPVPEWQAVIQEATTRAEIDIRGMVTAYQEAVVRSGLTESDWFDPFEEEDMVF